MFTCATHQAELQQRIDSIRLLLAEAHPSGATTAISREIRGLAVVLLYGAYENLLKSLCRSLLETVVQLRVGNRRLRPGIRLFAAHSKLQALTTYSDTGVWKAGFDIVATLGDSRSCSVSTGIFPNDGSNFKRPQIRTFCKVFGLPDPARVLFEIWERIDTVVTERNAVAHGQVTPDAIGRRYSLLEMEQLVNSWERGWTAFLDWIEAAASNRDFFRMPR
jgi:hypothetical protein